MSKRKKQRTAKRMVEKQANILANETARQKVLAALYRDKAALVNETMREHAHHLLTGGVSRLLDARLAGQDERASEALSNLLAHVEQWGDLVGLDDLLN